MACRQAGYTLIELMVVVGIVAIMTTFAFSAYQDYAIRTQVAEGLTLATDAQTGTSEYYTGHGRFPSNNFSAGLSAPTSMTGSFVSAIEVTRHDLGPYITIHFGTDAHGKIVGKHLKLRGCTNGAGNVVWLCGVQPEDGLALTCPPMVLDVDSIPARQLPANCAMR